MKRKGLTLIELMLAMSVTAVIATAIAFMLGAVASGVGTRRDVRSAVVLANAASARLSSYIVPSRCALTISDSEIVLWFEDSRESETVHATELRWLRFDADARELNVHYVDFPPEWTQPARDLEDLEYSSNTDWSAVYTYYSTRGWIKSRTLIDQLGSCAATSNAKSAMNARCISFELEFEFADQIIPFVMTMQMSQHEPPIS